MQFIMTGAMRWFCYSLLAVFLGVHQCRETGATEDAVETALLIQKNDSSDGSLIIKSHEKEAKNYTFPGKASVKRELRNESFTDLSPFLLLPFLSLLLPDVTKSKGLSKATNRNDTEVTDRQNSAGPLVLFDVTFDSREIPLKNETSLSKVSQDKPASQLFFGNLTWKPQETRRRTERKKTADIIHDFPSFLGDSIPEPDFLLADFPFLRKYERKSNRKSEQDKLRDSNNELKFIQDAFDESFLETEKEFREADPFAKLFQVVDGFFSGDLKQEEKAETKAKTTLDNPAIILDEVVKIGQFHVFDDGIHQNQRKGKRGTPRKSFSAYHRNRHERNTKKTHKSIDHARKNKPLLESFSRNDSSSQNNDTSRNNVIEPLRKHVHSKSLREDLSRNITEVLNRFLKLGQNEEFDWTEQETLDRHKSSRAKRQHNIENFDEYVETETKERQIADVHLLFLTVTLPTVFVLALLLLACLLSFRAKGKLCSRLFRPREGLVIERSSPSRGATASKPRPNKSVRV